MECEAFPAGGGPCCFAVHSCGDVSCPLLSCLGPAVCRGIDVVVGLSTTYVSVVCVVDSWSYALREFRCWPCTYV
jgi:hypothetical protein